MKLLLDKNDVASVLSISQSTVDRMVAAGQLHTPVLLFNIPRMATFTKRNSGWYVQVRRKGHKTIGRTFDSQLALKFPKLKERIWKKLSLFVPDQLHSILEKCTYYNVPVPLSQRRADFIYHLVTSRYQVTKEQLTNLP